MVPARRLAGAAGLVFAVGVTIGLQSNMNAQSAQPTTGSAAPTFTKDVLPILQRSCQTCHRPGTPAPMALTTYAETRPWARTIKQKVTTRQMPPWHIDRSIGEYANDPSLSDKEVATIAAWVDAGAPEGRAADAPPPITFPSTSEWTFGEPDLIVRMKKGFTIPAQGPDFIPEEIVGGAPAPGPRARAGPAPRAPGHG